MLYSVLLFCCLQDLEDMFSRYGRIVDIRLNRDRYTGRCKGFAFVCMGSEEEVDKVGCCGFVIVCLGY